ncbi:hypothetical protein H696_03812 [Fonticula alba]|uniref:t-SNARE coiled-coil homology domain-containing protein n=1 Tax=Fonticula alba TaxID=691883 RepID=A0A058Z5I5_FONAL|nr:hypothetical protein H696_03812 [Fonticula alba]KCV69381.1 hypothetical protein H696_03812 [Fonticula alba]|eukprot:XP_009495946.1 hypothetical protein H696_03812 [Fonticula alba]
MRDLMAAVGLGGNNPPPNASLDGGEFGKSPQSNAFLANVQTIRQLIDLMNKEVHAFQKEQDNVFQATRHRDEENLRKALDKKLAAIHDTSSQLRLALEKLKAQQKAWAMEELTKPAASQNNSESRLRTTQIASLETQTLEAIEGLQRAQVEYEERAKRRVLDQLLLVNPQADPSMVEGFFENPVAIFEGNQELMAMHSQQRQEATELLVSIQQRHASLLRLEKSLHELHQLFVDLQTLVLEQGEILNNIEYNVEAAVAETERGVGELRKSVKLQRKARKKMMIIIICLIIVLVVVAVPLLAVFIPKKK